MLERLLGNVDPEVARIIDGRFELAPHVSGPAPISGTVPDHPHTVGEIDIWSNGPNGINEYGAGDDVRSW